MIKVSEVYIFTILSIIINYGEVERGGDGERKEKERKSGEEERGGGGEGGGGEGQIGKGEGVEKIEGVHLQCTVIMSLCLAVV